MINDYCVYKHKYCAKVSATFTNRRATFAIYRIYRFEMINITVAVLDIIPRPAFHL